MKHETTNRRTNIGFAGRYKIESIMNLPVSIRSKALPMARLLRSILVSRGDAVAAQAFVEAKNWRDTPQVEHVSKALAVPLGTADQLIANWLPASIALVEALQPLTVFGRLQPMMRRVPFRTSLVSTTNDAEARFVGEYAGASGQVIPVTKIGFNPASSEVATEILNSAMLSLIVVFTRDLILRGPMGTDEHIAGELSRCLVKGMDIQFIDPSRNYDSARDAPASITAGATQYTSSGSTLAQVDEDLGIMVNALAANEMPLATAHWIMSPHSAISLSMMRGSGGAPAYPLVNARGGTLLGLL